jgi:predicted transcriptional regulator of viral defense system
MHSNYNNSQQAGIGQAERQIIDRMMRRGKLTIHSNDLEKEYAYTRQSANLMLSRLYRKGWLQRLRAGIYRVVPLGSDTANPIPEDPWAIAMELFGPSYISGWTAAEHWDLTEQIFNSTVIFTAQKQRHKDQIIAGLNYKTKFIRENNIFGVKKLWANNVAILIADIHRTIIDIVDEPELGGGGRHMIDIVKAYQQQKEADPEILWQYAEQLGHGAVFKRLGFIAQTFFHMPDLFLEKIKTKIKRGIINLDPQGPNSGPIITKWGLRLNIPLGDLT